MDTSPEPTSIDRAPATEGHRAVAQWPPTPLTTVSPLAVARYQEGITALVADAAGAEALLAEAVDADPGFALARAALAVARAHRGVPFALVDPCGGLSRGERQHLAVVMTLFAGDPGRAADLRREHLAEFPGDLLVVWLGRS